MELYGLIGKKLTHSFSPGYFKNKFQTLGIDAEYRLFEMDDPTGILSVVQKKPSLKGLNVTIPFKKSILPFLHHIDPEAKSIGSVNTIKINRVDGQVELHGFNTDIIGIEGALKLVIETVKQSKALILGTGGSAQSVAYVLTKMNIPFMFVSRNPCISTMIGYEEIEQEILSKHKLIINTTPVGMFPEIDQLPQLPYGFLSKDHILFDLIYNPEETLFLRKGKDVGAVTINGLGTLQIQADASWKIWQKPLIT